MAFNKLWLIGVLSLIFSIASMVLYGWQASLFFLLGLSLIVFIMLSKETKVSHAVDHILERQSILLKNSMQLLDEQLALIGKENEQIMLVVQAAMLQLAKSFQQLNDATHSNSARSEQVNEALVALQFEDLSTQLNQRIEKRVCLVNTITQIINEISQLDRHPDQLDHCEQVLIKANEEVQGLEPIVQSMSQQSIKQKSMNSGSVELF